MKGSCSGIHPSSFRLHPLKAFLGHFGFADGAVGVVDEVIDLVETAEEHGMTVDDDRFELGVFDGAAEGGEFRGLLADAFDHRAKALAAVRLLAGNAARARPLGCLFLNHGSNSVRIVEVRKS